MHTDEVRAALDYLKIGCARGGIIERFWRALHYQDAFERRRLALAELRAITRAVPLFEVQSRKSDF